MMPTFFIAHGAPLLAIEQNDYTQFLTDLGQKLPKPKAVVIFSAHWESNVQQVSDVETFDTIYDFGGFPEALYRIKYPAQGNKDATNAIAAAFEKQNISYQINSERGLDHGAWVVLRLLYPRADIPVISMSVNPILKPEEQYKVGKALASLRADNMMMIGSGGTVHNLRALNMRADALDGWAVEFDDWLAEHLRSWNLAALFDYRKQAPSAALAVPEYGTEHFIPLFYAMGAADGDRTAQLLHRSFRYGNLSHSVWQFG